MLTLRIRRLTAAAILVCGAFAGACSEPTSTDGINAPPTETPTETPTPASVVRVAPDTVTMEPGDSLFFVAVDSLATGSRGGAAVVWSASGGTVDAAGLFRAPSQPGSYRVIARGANGADSALVIVGSGLGTGATPVTGTDGAMSAVVSGAQVVLLPSTLSLAPGGKQQFSAVGRYSGATYSIPASSLTWQASGGSITSGGYYTAPASSGSYRVIARVVDSRLAAPVADTTIVTVGSVTTAPAPSPTLSSVVLTPATATVAAGATQQLTAQGKMSDGSTAAVAVTYAATGGTVSTSGLYKAGTTAGSYRVIAVQQGGTKADTSAITVTTTATAPTPPPAAAPCNGTADPTLLPMATGQAPNVVAYTAFNVRGMAAGVRTGTR